MKLCLKRIEYAKLNPRQKEIHNFQKLSALLADFGFTTIRLTDDWQGADFLAQHFSDGQILKVQLKGGFAINKKYLDKDIWIAFRQETDWYLYPHDAIADRILNITNIKNTDAWQEKGSYIYTKLTKQLRQLLKPYCLTGK